MAIISGGNIIEGVISRGGVEQIVVAGGAAGPLVATGVQVGDTLISVIESAAGVLTDRTEEFTISDADEIDNTGGTATTGDSLLVTFAKAGR